MSSTDGLEREAAERDLWLLLEQFCIFKAGQQPVIKEAVSALYDRALRATPATAEPVAVRIRQVHPVGMVKPHGPWRYFDGGTIGYQQGEEVQSLYTAPQAVVVDAVEVSKLRDQIANLERIKNDLSTRLFKALETEPTLKSALYEVDHAEHISRRLCGDLLDIACVHIARVAELEQQIATHLAIKGQQPDVSANIQEGAAAFIDGEKFEVDAVIACLGDDAASLRVESPMNEEIADNMDRAADLLEKLSTNGAAAQAEPVTNQMLIERLRELGCSERIQHEPDTASTWELTMQQVRHLLGYAATPQPPGGRLTDEKAERTNEMHRIIAQALHDNTVAMQAAWIEWRRGRGAEVAMEWIENILMGPGHIPREDEPFANEPQAYFDKNKSNPFPDCFCGRPSNSLWMGQGFCSEAHYKEGQRAAIAKPTITAGAGE